jgi:hypothetical protein
VLFSGSHLLKQLQGTERIVQSVVFVSRLIGYYFFGSLDNRPVRSSNPLRQLVLVEFQHCAFVEVFPRRTEGGTNGNEVIQLSHKCPFFRIASD